jgi:hypothetical protein
MKKRTKKILIILPIAILSVLLLFIGFSVLFFFSCPPYYFLNSYNVVNESGQDILITPLESYVEINGDDYVRPTGRYERAFCRPNRLKGTMILLKDGESVTLDVYDEHTVISHILISDMNYEPVKNEKVYLFDPYSFYKEHYGSINYLIVPPLKDLKKAPPPLKPCFHLEKTRCILDDGQPPSFENLE